MPIAWFTCPYDQKTVGAFIERECAMNRFDAQIRADGGIAREIELGLRALVLVEASAVTLSAIAATTGFKRIPASLRSTQLSTLTGPQRSAIRAELLACGYTELEITTRFGATIATLGTHTLDDVLRFLARRRLHVRFDTTTGQIILTGTHTLLPDTEVDRLETEVLTRRFMFSAQRIITRLEAVN